MEDKWAILRCAKNTNVDAFVPLKIVLEKTKRFHILKN